MGTSFNATSTIFSAKTLRHFKLVSCIRDTFGFVCCNFGINGDHWYNHKLDLPVESQSRLDILGLPSWFWSFLKAILSSDIFGHCFDVFLGKLKHLTMMMILLDSIAWHFLFLELH